MPRIPNRSPEIDAPDGPPAPLEQAAPDAELVERHESDPDLDEGAGNGNGSGDGSHPPGSRRRRGGGGGGGDDSGGDLEPSASGGRGSSPARHRNGLIAFARGSWRELQRVQWPDQRQVMQATGVVIGFVIVAGAYLALADFVANKIVHFILS